MVPFRERCSQRGSHAGCLESYGTSTNDDEMISSLLSEPKWFDALSHSCTLERTLLFLMVKVLTDQGSRLNVRVSVCRFLLQSTCGSERR